jgi:hypothetical protein
MEFTIFISNENFTIQHFIVFKDVVEHLLVEIFRRILEGYFHATGFLLLEVNVP